MKLEILEIFGPKLGKLVSRLELKLEKWKKHELTMCSNSKFWSSMKLEFYEKWACSSTIIYMYTLFKWWEIHGSIHLKDANRDWYMYLDKKSFRLCSTWSQEKLLQSEICSIFTDEKVTKHHQLLFLLVNLLGTTMWIISFFLIDSMACSTSFFNLLNGSWWQEWS